jgi:RND family efflux transporter MFP subunit
LYGAATCLVVVGAVAFFFWPTGGAPAGATGAGPPGGGFGFGPSPVEVATAVETMAAEPVRVVGQVAPVRQAVVAGEVEGRVAELLVDEGDTVRAGDVLLRLDSTTAELDLDASRAQRAEAQARLVRFESEVRRITDLRERGAISEREFEQAIADRDAQSQAVTRIEAEAARLQELIARAEITAPFTGEVTAVHAELGEWNARGGDVVTLVDLSAVEVTANAAERYISQIDQARRDGVDVPVEFEALPGRYIGTVKAIIAQANPLTHTFPVIVLVPNPDGLIRAGMSARVLTQVGDPVPTVLVPKDALVLRSGRTFVFRTVPMQAPPGAGAAGGGAPDGAGAGADAPATAPSDGPPLSGVEEIEVEVGNGYGAWQVVRGGIAAGDQVVVRGNETLLPGMPVVVSGVADIEPPPSPAADIPMGRRKDGRQ